MDVDPRMTKNDRPCTAYYRKNEIADVSRDILKNRAGMDPVRRFSAPKESRVRVDRRNFNRRMKRNARFHLGHHR